VNAVCEHFHDTIKNQLQSIFHSNPPQDIGNALDVVDSGIASTVFASQVAIHWTLGVSPGGLTCQHDILHSIPILADFEVICQRTQKKLRSLNLVSTLWIWRWSPSHKVYKPAGIEQWVVLGPFPIKKTHVWNSHDPPTSAQGLWTNQSIYVELAPTLEHTGRRQHDLP
jgi:hypothetical protein